MKSGFEAVKAMTEMGIHGYLEQSKSTPDEVMKARLAIVKQTQYPFGVIRTDMEPRWAAYGEEFWREKFWRTRVQNILGAGKRILVGLAYGTDYRTDKGWNTRFTSQADLDLALKLFQAGIDVTEEECAKAGMRPQYVFWNEPRPLNEKGEQTGGAGWDDAFLKQTEFIVTRLDTHGAELGAPTLHGPMALIKDNVRVLFTQYRQAFKFVDRFDFFPFNYYPGNDSPPSRTGAGMTVADYLRNVDGIVDAYRKYTPRPIELHEWAWNLGPVGSKDRRDKNRILYAGLKAARLRAAHYFSLIDPNSQWLL